jgi:dimethylamine monooxygenase subunit C
MNEKELIFSKGKRKYLFCTDIKGEEFLTSLIQQVVVEKVPYDYYIFKQEMDTFIDTWFRAQKMGTYLYIAGYWEFVKRVQKLAVDAGFTQHEMQIKICGPIKKMAICCRCHGVNELADERQITCMHCGLELEVSDHYSRRLDAYLGYNSIN